MPKDKAFVEEGTSLHYYEQIDFARPDEQLFEQLQKIPGAKVLPIVTTDAVYRQTFYKEQLWREKGAVAADMETSAPVERREVPGPAGGLGADDLRP